MVAEEIRKLADQSGEASANIGQILDQLKDRIVSVAEEINESAAAATTSVEKVNDILNIFENITSTTMAAKENVDREYKIIENVKDQFGHIKQNMDEMVLSTGDSTEAITEIVRTVEEQKDAIGSISDGMHKIADLSDQLQTRLG